LSGKTILVVDDQINVRNILEFNLKRRGFTIITAADGAAALREAREKLPALILLDLMLPEVDGFEVLAQLRAGEKTRDIPVLIISAKGTEEDILQALKSGARDYMIKPFNLELLIQKVIKRLEESEAAAPAAPAAPALNLPVFHVLKMGTQFPAENEGLHDQLLRLAANKPKAIILDLTHTGEIDAAAWKRLAETQKALKPQNTSIKLITAAPEHKKSLEEAGAVKHFEVFPNWHDALREFQGEA